MFWVIRAGAIKKARGALFAEEVNRKFFLKSKFFIYVSA